MFVTRHEIQEFWKRMTGGRQYPILTKQPRKIPNGEHILNRMEFGQTVMVCKECEDSRTLVGRGYTELRRYHADAICDGCQEYGSVAMWLFQDHTWHQDLKGEEQLKNVRQRDLMNSSRFR